MNTSQTDKVKDVLLLFKRLSIKEKISVSRAIDNEILLERAAALDKAIVPNDISMPDINSELKAYRSERKNIRSRR